MKRKLATAKAAAASTGRLRSSRHQPPASARSGDSDRTGIEAWQTAPRRLAATPSVAYARGAAAAA